MFNNFFLNSNTDKRDMSLTLDNLRKLIYISHGDLKFSNPPSEIEKQFFDFFFQNYMKERFRQWEDCLDSDEIDLFKKYFGLIDSYLNKDHDEINPTILIHTLRSIFYIFLNNILHNHQIVLSPNNEITDYPFKIMKKKTTNNVYYFKKNVKNNDKYILEKENLDNVENITDSFKTIKNNGIAMDTLMKNYQKYGAQIPGCKKALLQARLCSAG
ncbi:unnamed protein product [Gordionus sp. m RMFG-2023]